MDVISLKALSTIFVAVAFVGICWWAFAPSRKKRFEEAANLPFVEDDDNDSAQAKSSDSVKVSERGKKA